MHFLLYPQPLHLYLLFCYHNLCLAYILPVLTTKPTPYWNFTSSFDFDHVSSAACDFASAYQVSSKLDHLLLSCDVISIFRDGGHSVGNLRIPVWWRLALEKVKDYTCTKFCQDISIHSWDITTSGFWKQTAAILKFYIRFPFWCLHCQSSWKCNSPLVYQISSKSVHQRRSYDVVAIFKMVAVWSALE